VSQKSSEEKGDGTREKFADSPRVLEYRLDSLGEHLDRPNTSDETREHSLLDGEELCVVEVLESLDERRSARRKRETRRVRTRLAPSNDLS